MKKYCSSTKSGIRRQKLWTTTSWEPYVSWMWFGSKGYSVGKNQENKRLLTWDQTTSLCKSAPLLQKNQGDGRRRTKAGQQRQEKEDDFNSYRPWKARGHEIYKHVCLLNGRTLVDSWAGYTLWREKSRQEGMSVECQMTEWTLVNSSSSVVWRKIL